MHIDSPVSLVIFALTVVLSVIAFKNVRLRERFILRPYQMFRNRQYDRLITSGFVHADGWHLAFNMITFYFFGFPLEEYIGSIKFFLLYLLGLLLSDFGSAFKHRKDPNYATLGASGAVLAVMFAYIVYAPTQMILIFVVPMPGWVYAIGFLAYSYWQASQSRGSNINHDAHISGALTGVAFVGLTDPYALQRAVHSIF